MWHGRQQTELPHTLQPLQSSGINSFSTTGQNRQYEDTANILRSRFYMFFLFIGEQPTLRIHELQNI